MEEKLLKRRKQSRLDKEKEEEERRKFNNKVSASAFTAGVRRKAPLKEIQDNPMAECRREENEAVKKTMVESSDEKRRRKKGNENDIFLSPERLVIDESVLNTPINFVNKTPGFVNASTSSSLPLIAMETTSPSVLGPPTNTTSNLRHVNASTLSFRPPITMETSSSPGELFSSEECDGELEEDCRDKTPPPPSLSLKMTKEDLLAEVDYCIAMCDHLLDEI